MTSHILPLHIVLTIICTGVIGISPHANNTLSKVLIRAARKSVSEYNEIKEANDSLDYKIEHSKGYSNLLLPAKKINDIVICRPIATIMKRALIL